MADKYLKALSFVTTLFALVLFVGCEDSSDAPSKKTKKDAEPPVEGKKVTVAPGVTLEILAKTRRVLVDAEVCLREGPLEQLLTRKNKKEHEAILAADIDARKLHEALLLANAKTGSPVEWLPKYKAPTGTTIKVTIVYSQKGKKISVPARSWIQNIQNKKELETDWVFAGSMLVENPFDKNKPKHYLANDGDVICISNFETAMLDIPVQSAKSDENRGYIAWTNRIPPIGTKVTLILEPVTKK